MSTWRSCSVASLFVWLAAASAAPPPRFQHGVCYAHAWRDGLRSGYGTPTSKSTLERLHRLGVDAISLTPFGYERSLDDLQVHLANHFRGGETDEAVAATARQAHALGMRVMLKPHIWVGGGAWVGSQRFGDEAAFGRWFASYRLFVLHYAQLAAAAHADWFVLGTELAGASGRDRARWAALIKQVRAIYSGRLTYAANWNEAERVVFWDLLDAVGVQEYAPVASARDPDLSALRAGWARISAGLAALAHATGRPIIITELGYRAAPFAARDPATWPESLPQAIYDGVAQARCYRAALEALTHASWCRGVYIWKWFTDSRDEKGRTDFSPTGKPAEKVLREFYQPRQLRP